jgi:hypothetical protein
MNIEIPDDEITGWQMRLDDIKRDIAVLDERRRKLISEQATLQRKIMSIDFLTNATKLADSVRMAQDYSILGLMAGTSSPSMIGAKMQPGTTETDADPRNPNVR